MDQIMSRGFVVALTAIALVLIGLVAAPLFASNDITEFRAGINQIATNMQQTYRLRTGRYGTTQIPAATLFAQKIVPENMMDTTNMQVVSVYGQPCVVTGNSGLFDIDCDGIPQADCIKLVSGSFGGGVVVNARAASSLAGLGAATPFSIPATDTNATTACAVEESNAIRLTFR